MTPNENPGCSSSSVGVCTSVLSKTNEWRKDFRKGKKKYCYCTICSEFPEICRQFAYRDRIPSIVQASGTRYQSGIVIQHHKSKIHSACVDAKRKKELFQHHSAVHPMLKCIADMDKEVRQKAIKCLYDVYNDAKRGTLSAWSLPSRVMAEYAAKHLILRTLVIIFHFLPLLKKHSI